jgi:NitT/TauT family transport system substrate-binding protein
VQEGQQRHALDSKGWPTDFHDSSFPDEMPKLSTPPRRMTQAELGTFVDSALAIIGGQVDHAKIREHVEALLFLKRTSDIFEEAVLNLAKDLGEDLAHDPAVQKRLLPFVVPASSLWEKATANTPLNLGQSLNNAFGAIVRVNAPKFDDMLNRKIDFTKIDNLAELKNYVASHKFDRAHGSDKLLGKTLASPLPSFASPTLPIAADGEMPERLKSPLKRFLAPLAAALLLLVAVLLPSYQRKEKLSVALNVWPGSETLTLAWQQKQISPKRFQLAELPWTSAVIRALDNHAVDVAVLPLDSVLRMRETGQDISVLLVMDVSTGGDALVTRASTTEITSLKGRRVAADFRSSGVYVLACALESVGLTLDDVDLVPMIQPEMEAAIIAGNVDAVVAAEPWLTLVRKAGAHSLYDSSQMEVPVMRVLVATREACRNYSTDLAALIRAHLGMSRLLRSTPTIAGINAVLRREGLSQIELQDCLKRWRSVDVAENNTLLDGPTPGILPLADTIQKVMVRNGLLGQLPEHQDWIDTSILREVQK